jgi:pentatricopeptide repeat protein
MFSLAYAYHATHQPEKAVENYQRALRLSPDFVEALNGLAWLYATDSNQEIRSGKEAIRLAERGCDLTKRKKSSLLDTLAAAYAEAGRFDDAVKTTKEMMRDATVATNSFLLANAKQRLSLYEAHRPFRDE